MMVKVIPLDDLLTNFTEFLKICIGVEILRFAKVNKYKFREILHQL